MGLVIEQWTVLRYDITGFAAIRPRFVLAALQRRVESGCSALAHSERYQKKTYYLRLRRDAGPLMTS